MQYYKIIIYHNNKEIKTVLIYEIAHMKSKHKYKLLQL